MKENKFTVLVAYGRDIVNKINDNEFLTDEEDDINVKTYSFDTEKELHAFTKGLDEAVGWLELNYFKESEEATILKRLPRQPKKFSSQ